MKAGTKLLSNFFSRANFMDNLHFIAFFLIFCLILPILCTFIIWYFGKITRSQFGKALGNSSQMVIGCIGNFIHEMENIIIARIGGHRIRGVHCNTVYCYKHFGYMGDADHNWQSSSMYESLFDIFLGIMPVYITTLLLWGIQNFLGKDNYISHDSTALSWKSLWNLKPAVTHGFNTAFSTGHFITDIVYLIVVILIASTAYSISMDELKRTQNGLIVWVPALILISAIIAFIGKTFIVLPYLWNIGYFTAFGLGRTIAYLLVITIMLVFFTLISYVFKDVTKLFSKRQQA